MPNPRTPENFLPGTERPITDFDFGNFVADAENGLIALRDMVGKFDKFDSAKKEEIDGIIEGIKEKLTELKSKLKE